MIHCKICQNLFEPTSGPNKICSEDCRKKAYLKNKEKWRTKTDNHRKVWSNYTNNWRRKNPERSKVTAFKTKAKNLGLPFDLDEEFFRDVPKVCPILGIKLDSSCRESQWSVDRIKPELGYIKENCQIISMRANRLKQDSSLAELEKIIQYMKESA